MADKQEAATMAQPIQLTEASEGPSIPAHLAQSQSDRIQIDYTNWKMTKSAVKYADSQGIICNIKWSMRKPHLKFTAPDESDPWATVNFNLLGTKVYIDLRGRSFEMKCDKLLKMVYSFTSEAFGNQTLTWNSQSHWKTIDFICLNEQQLAVAKISTVQWLSNQVAELELVGAATESDAARDELMVTGLSLMNVVQSMKVT